MDRLELLGCKLVINVAEHLEALNNDTVLADHELFVLMDNSAFEGSCYKGHLMSKELRDIVFCLYKAQQKGGFILHVLHISGKRMKNHWGAQPVQGGSH